MILEVYSIRDAKAEYFNTPFFQKTKGEAIRNFSNAVNDEKTQLNQHPEDFDLWKIGQWDDQKGQIVSLSTPEHVVKAVDFTQNN